jgi:hypothetical protein
MKPEVETLATKSQMTEILVTDTLIVRIQSLGFQSIGNASLGIQSPYPMKPEVESQATEFAKLKFQ